jgi:hypothetical protein
MKKIVFGFFGILVFMLVAGSMAMAASEPAFNALPDDSPLHAEYQKNLCDGTLEVVHHLTAEKHGLDHLNQQFDRKTAAQREDWAVNYAVTAALIDIWRARYDKNCGGAS